MRAFAGFGCSYRGKYFGGYAPHGAGPARRAILKKAPLIAGVEFSCLDYREVEIPDRTLIYCDIPYRGTTQYGVRFDHDAFWNWAETTSKTHPIVVSEYARNAGPYRILAKRSSTCFMSDRHTIPTEEVLLLLSPQG